MGAPVMMRTASPGPTRTFSGDAPAASVPTTLSSTGGSVVSTARTAKPSIAVLSNGGTSSSASSGMLVMHPRASCRSTARGVSGTHARSTEACTSSSGVSGMRLDELLALHQIGEEGTEGGTEVVTLDGHLYRGLEVVELLADVVARLVEDESEDLLVLEQQRHGVGELDVAARTRLHALERPEDLRREHVATHDRQVRRRRVRRRLLDHVEQADERVFDGLGPHAAVRGDLGKRHLLEGDDGPAIALVYEQHLVQHVRRAAHHVVAE